MPENVNAISVSKNVNTTASGRVQVLVSVEKVTTFLELYLIEEKQKTGV